MANNFSLFNSLKIKNKNLLIFSLGIAIILLEAGATFSMDDQNSEGYSSGREAYCSDSFEYDSSEDDPYAIYLNEKSIQERRINRAAENTSYFIKKSEEEIENVMKLVLPIISGKEIIHSSFNKSDYPSTQSMGGYLFAKIIKALSEIEIEEREDIVELTKLFYKEQKDQIFPNSTFPHIITALSTVPKKERKKNIQLTHPFYNLYAESNGFGFSNDYPALVLNAISNIPEQERDKIMEQITPRIIETLPAFTKNCVFKIYRDGGNNGKRRNQHAQIIEIIAKVSKDDRESVLDYTFQDSFLPGNVSYQDRRGRTCYLEKSYADMDEIVLKKMKVIKEIPAYERTDILERIKLIANEKIRNDYFIEVLEALSKFSKDQRDAILIDILLKRQKGEDFLPFIMELSKISENQRDSIKKIVEEVNKKFARDYEHYRYSQFIQTLVKIPEDQRESVINDSLGVFVLSKTDKMIDGLSTLMEILSVFSEEERHGILEKVEILQKKKSIGISDCAHVIQMLSKAPKEQRADLITILMQPFLINLKESGTTCSYQTPGGNSINASSWGKILESFLNTPKEEREDLFNKAQNLMAVDMSRDDCAQIIECLSKISYEKREGLFCDNFLKNKNPSNFIDFLKSVINLEKDQRNEVLRIYDLLLSRNFIKSYNGRSNTAVLDTLAEIPSHQRRIVVLASIPLLLNSIEGIFSYEETAEYQNLEIIKAVAETPENERTDIIFHALFLCTGDQGGKRLTITPTYSAPQITMPSNPRPIILNSLAKVKAGEERNELVELTNQFQIKKHGEYYIALVIKEIADMPLKKRNLALKVSNLEEKQNILYSTEESTKEFRKGFDLYAEYLARSTFSEVCGLRIINAVSQISENYKRKLSKYAEAIFINIPESDIRDFVIKVSHNLSGII